MPFYVDGKEYSEKEAYQDLQRCKKERHDWCEQKVREFFAHKVRDKYYHVKYYEPDVEYDLYYALPYEIEEQIKAEMQEVIEHDGPYKSKKDELESISGIIDYLNIDWGDYLESSTHEIRTVDFDEYVYCYNVKTIRIDFKGAEKCYYNTGMYPVREMYHAVRFTDEEYIQILTEMLYNPTRLSLDGLRNLLPDIVNKIYRQCAEKYETTATYLYEMNQDVDTILEQVGGVENTLHYEIFCDPFAMIAEHFGADE